MADNSICSTIESCSFSSCCPRSSCILPTRIPDRGIFSVHSFNTIPGSRGTSGTPTVGTTVSTTSSTGNVILIDNNNFATAAIFLGDGMALFVRRNDTVYTSGHNEKCAGGAVVCNRGLRGVIVANNKGVGNVNGCFNERPILSRGVATPPRCISVVRAHHSCETRLHFTRRDGCNKPVILGGYGGVGTCGFVVRGDTC